MAYVAAIMLSKTDGSETGNDGRKFVNTSGNKDDRSVGEKLHSPLLLNLCDIHSLHLYKMYNNASQIAMPTATYVTVFQLIYATSIHFKLY
jgi:hypothetical protein